MIRTEGLEATVYVCTSCTVVSLSTPYVNFNTVSPLGLGEIPGDQPRQRQRKGEEERRKERCIRWGRCAASPDVMTNFVPGGPVSVGRIVSCPSPSRHPLVELLCADGGDFVNVRNPIPRISLPESVRRTSPGCGSHSPS